MDKIFLNKVLGQLDRETTIDYEKERIHHAFPSLSYITSDFPNSLSPATAYYFSIHCMDIYGLNKEEIDYVWVEYINNIKDKLSNGINESHVYKTSEDDFTNRVVSMLDQPPYLPILSPMGLDEEDYKRVFKKIYGEDVRVKYFKEEEIELRVSSKIGIPKPLYVEILRENGANYWEKWDYSYGKDEWRRYVDSEGDRRLRSENGLIIYDDHIEDCCPEELEDGFYPPLPTNINENVDDNSKNPLDIPLLTKVAQQLMRETTFDVVEFFNRNHLFLKSPMYNHQVNFSDILINSPSYHGSVSEHIRSVYGLDWFEVNYVWLKYIDLIHQKIKKEKLPIGEQIINESQDNTWYYQYIFDSKYLSKVLEQLLSETKIDNDSQYQKITVGWDTYSEHTGKVDYDKFAEHCREIYSLNNIEVSDMWNMYVMTMKKKLNQED